MWCRGLSVNHKKRALSMLGLWRILKHYVHLVKLEEKLSTRQYPQRTDCVMSDLLSRLDPLILQVQHLKAVQKNLLCGLGESGGER